MTRVILASASPRRHDLLRMIGIAHEVVPADIDESLRRAEDPVAYAERLARGKGAAVVARYPEAVIIAADTIVVIDGQVLGKPQDEAQARRMLRQLAGRTHTVFTAVAAVLGAGYVRPIAADSGQGGQGGRGGPAANEAMGENVAARMVSAVEQVAVTFRELSDAAIAAYVATGEPMDKAGAYGIQGYGATIVDRIDGDFFAVMGLPLARLIALLERLGVHYEFGALRLDHAPTNGAARAERRQRRTGDARGGTPGDPSGSDRRRT